MKKSLSHIPARYFFKLIVAVATLQAVISILPTADSSDINEDEIVVFQAAIEESSEPSNHDLIRQFRPRPLNCEIT